MTSKHIKHTNSRMCVRLVYGSVAMCERSGVLFGNGVTENRVVTMKVVDEPPTVASRARTVPAAAAFQPFLVHPKRAPRSTIDRCVRRPEVEVEDTSFSHRLCVPHRSLHGKRNGKHRSGSHFDR